MNGKALIQRGVEIAKGVGGIDQVIVATDSNKIASLGEMSGAESILTNSNHQNGTERLLEVMKSREADYYINLQVDEPLIDKKEIKEALNTLIKSDIEILTICRPISLEEAKPPSIVKAIISEKIR
ncbi:cytidylyltransferase domain-containing protein [Prochlorococcus marinus]|uniref:cytidylyltransferase domain-containing protein n=1 Tax=Prochlorococcus marinus TaxID=1219 RepID=UPI002FBE2580